MSIVIVCALASYKRIATLDQMRREMTNFRDKIAVLEIEGKFLSQKLYEKIGGIAEIISRPAA